MSEYVNEMATRVFNTPDLRALIWSKMEYHSDESLSRHARERLRVLSEAWDRDRPCLKVYCGLESAKEAEVTQKLMEIQRAVKREPLWSLFGEPPWSLFGSRIPTSQDGEVFQELWRQYKEACAECDELVRRYHQLRKEKAKEETRRLRVEWARKNKRGWRYKCDWWVDRDEELVPVSESDSEEASTRQKRKICD